jgi:glycerophosphoryl diester phosphodiesterase
MSRISPILGPTQEGRMRRIEIQGHRGARGLWPENTAEGFRRSVALGVDSIETDVAVTADGVPVLHHDPALHGDMARLGDAWIGDEAPAIAGMTLAALRRYDVGRPRPGSELAARYPRLVGMNLLGVPTLAEGLVASAPVVLDVEIKTFPDGRHATASPERMVDLVVAAAVAGGALGRLVVRSFDWRALRHLRLHFPAVPCAVLTSPATTNATWWDGIEPGESVAASVAAFAGAGATGMRVTWAPEWKSIGEADVAAAHALGLRVVPWTVNDAEAMRRLLGWGCDGLCSDEPDVALAVRAAQ